MRASTVGGLASVAGGGKFANGATTAAFGYLFNALAEVLGWAGSRGGALVGAGLCVEGGPLAVICGIAGASVGRSVGTSIGAAIDGVFWNENAAGAPALPEDPYSPESVAKRQSEWRRQLGAPSNDPDSPIPDQGPGRDLGGHTVRGRTPHVTGERNVNPNEEHSIKPKGGLRR